MHRLLGFVLYALAIGSFVAATKTGGLGCSARLPLPALVLTAVGSMLAFGAVLVPWSLYVRGDHNRVKLSEYTLGIVGGIVVAAIPAAIVLVLTLGGHYNCGS